MKLVLASLSSTRREMLKAAGVRFTAAAAQLSEERRKTELNADGLAPHAIAKELADAKALSLRPEPGTLVIGSDQVLEHGAGETFDKPHGVEEAFRQLKSLSGRSHFLHAAVSVAEEGRIVWHHVDTVRLTMRRLSDPFLHHYLETEYETVKGAVGAYHLEGRGAQLFEQVEGSHFSVMGLPLLPLLAYLRTRGVLAR